MRPFLQKYSIAIFILVALIITVGMVVWGNNPNSPAIIRDLGLNLVSEVFGILLTVLIIDVMIKRNEDSRWLPTKHITYAKITEIALEIQYYLNTEDERKKQPIVVFFGVTDARPDYHQSVSIEKFEEIVNQYHKRVREIIDLTGMLLEPEIQTHLNALERNLEKTAGLFVKYKDLDKLKNPLLPIINFVEVKESVDKIVSLMLEKSTGKIPFHERT
ncbi:MAG TPA: hypothetical protein PLT08_17700 [Anaerolineales bacterium]|nr:hypothetical protein [Anaerolineales bacterium]